MASDNQETHPNEVPAFGTCSQNTGPGSSDAPATVDVVPLLLVLNAVHRSGSLPPGTRRARPTAPPPGLARALGRASTVPEWAISASASANRVSIVLIVRLPDPSMAEINTPPTGDA